MPVRTSYAQGTPNWVDLQTPDTEAAKAFYTSLFGWAYDDQPMPEGGPYSMATLGGQHVAAIAPQSPDLAAAGAPAVWNTYLAVDNVDDALAKVEAAGGQVAMPAFDVMDAGRMGFVLDPSGAAVAFWQARQHIGASLVNEPGAVVWNELITDRPGRGPVLRAGARREHCGDGHGRTVRTRCSRSAARRSAGPPHRSSRASPATGRCTSPRPTPMPPWPRPLSSAGLCWPGRSTRPSAGWPRSATPRAGCSASSSRPRPLSSNQAGRSTLRP